MRLPGRPSPGLVGRIVAILLLALGIEFAVSTFLYERASQFSVREDEARRLAEHLVIARKLVSERPWRERADMADELTTDRYVVQWSPIAPRQSRVAPGLSEMERQVVAWEPPLRETGLRLRLTSPGRRGIVVGGLRLNDGSWLHIRTREHVVGEWPLALGRILLAVVPAIALLVIGGLLVRRTLSPMDRLARAAGRIGIGRTEILPMEGPQEVQRVITAFNEMQARIHRLIQDRTEALAAVGHDLRTPLSRLQLRTDDIEADELRSAIQGDVAEMEAMVESLLAYLGGEADPERPIVIDLAVMLATIVDDAIDRDRDATYEGLDHLEARVRPIALKRAVVNLVDNALHYGEAVRVRLDAVDGEVRIRVEDDGPGIPEDELAAALRPFHRLDPARGRNTGGLGLGLAIVRDVVAREEGRLMLSNRPEGGLAAEIALPRRS